MFIVSVTFDIEATHAAEFVDAVLKQAQNSLQLESECHVFDVCMCDDEPTRIFLYEKYSDAAAFDTHLQSEHFAAFDALVTPWVAAKHVDTWTQLETHA